MPFTAFEIGYTIEMPVREAAHATHINTVPALSLVDAICRHEFPTSGLQLRARIIFTCWKPNHAVTEHMFSIITQSYNFLGGFNSTMAGISTASARKTPSSVYEHWANMMDLEVIKERMAEEKDKVLTEIDSAKEYKAAIAKVEGAKKARDKRWKQQNLLRLTEAQNEHQHARLEPTALEVAEVGRALLQLKIKSQAMDEFGQKFVAELKVLKETLAEAKEKSTAARKAAAASASASRKRAASQISTQ